MKLGGLFSGRRVGWYREEKHNKMGRFLVVQEKGKSELNKSIHWCFYTGMGSGGWAPGPFTGGGGWGQGAGRQTHLLGEGENQR